MRTKKSIVKNNGEKVKNFRTTTDIFRKIIVFLLSQKTVESAEIFESVGDNEKSAGAMLNLMVKFIPEFIKVEKISSRKNIYTLTPAGHQTDIEEMREVYRKRKYDYKFSRKGKLPSLLKRITPAPGIFVKNSETNAEKEIEKISTEKASERMVLSYLKEIFETKPEILSETSQEEEFSIARNSDTMVLGYLQKLLESYKKKEMLEISIKPGNREKIYFLRTKEGNKLTISFGE